MRDDMDGQALEALLQQPDVVRRFLLRLSADRHGVDDAVQDAWVAALCSPPRHRGNVRGWFAVLLRNALRMRQRAELRRVGREAIAARDEAVGPVDEAVARAELHQRLVALVLALAEPQRSLVLLHYFEGIEVRELARQRAMTADAVRAHLKRARDELRRRLEADARQRRTLLGLAVGLAGSTLPAIGAGMAMQKVAGGLLIVAVAAAVWCGVDWSDGPAPLGDETLRVDAAQAAATANRTDAAAPENRRTSVPADVTAHEPSVPFRVQLRGLHPKAPWTAIVHVDLDGRDEGRQEWLSHPAHDVPDAAGFLNLQLPPWSATMLRKLRVRADDRNYQEFDLRFDGELPSSREIAIDVQVVAELTGRVVDERGTPVPAARVVAFASTDGQPHDGALASTNTADNGTFVLAVPPASPLLLVAAAMEEASLSGMRMRGKHGAIGDVGVFRRDLLPSAKSAAGVIGVASAVGDLVLRPAASIEGRVVWSDGRPVAKAEVELVPDRVGTQLHLDEGAAVLEADDRSWSPVARVRSGDDGAFALPGVGGEHATVRVTSVPEHLLVGGFAIDGIAPMRSATLVLPLPIRLRAAVDGVDVEDAEFLVEIARNRVARRRADDGECRVVLGDGDHDPASVIARAGAMVTARTALEQTMAGRTVVLSMQRGLARLQVEFEGEARVRNAAFDFLPVARGTRAHEVGIRDDRRGPFEFWLQPGQYRMQVWSAGGEWNGTCLLPQERVVELPPAGQRVVVPALFGGKLTVEVRDGMGRWLPGSCRLSRVGAAGGVVVPCFRVGSGETSVHGVEGHVLPVGPNECVVPLPPGEYEFEFDLGNRGVHRQRATIRALETTTVTLRLP